MRVRINSTLISATKVEFIKTYSSSDIKAVLPELARVVGNDGAHVYRVTYEAKAPNGSVVLLSGSR